jgi:hypothetical protein
LGLDYVPQDSDGILVVASKIGNNGSGGAAYRLMKVYYPGDTTGSLSEDNATVWSNVSNGNYADFASFYTSSFETKWSGTVSQVQIEISASGVGTSRVNTHGFVYGRGA